VRRPSPFTERRDPVDIKMTPMIDVVFLLMIYFIWSSNTGTAEQLLPSSISPPTTGAGNTPTDANPKPEDDFPPIVVRIVPAGNDVGWRVQDAEMPSFAAVQQKLQNLFGIQPKTRVVLHPDPNVPLGHVIDVFDLARLIGFQEVQFAVNSP
jgi:biopolymer transport protein ExbD